MSKTQEPAIPWLLLVLSSQLTLSWLDGDIGPSFNLEGRVFEEVGDGAITGFYDRLFRADGEFVGIQITPVPALEVIAAARNLPYARTLADGNVLQLFFVGVPFDQPLEVTDQAFGGRVYRCFAGELAISIDTFFMEDFERAAIAMTTSRWIDAHSLEG